MSVTDTIKKFFTNGEPTPVGADEKIVGYDKDHLREYREMQEAQDLLAHVNDKGFRKPNNRQIAKAKDVVQDYRRLKAKTFLEEHKTRIEYYGVEIKAYFEELPNGLIKPSLTIADYNPFREIAPVKAWSEALEENLAARVNCTHELNEDETACKKCNLNPENWGSNKEGVTDEYHEKQLERIAKQKEIELACERGEHELNKEAVEDANAPMQFCVHCRLPKAKWTKPEEAQQEAGQS